VIVNGNILTNLTFLIFITNAAATANAFAAIIEEGISKNEIKKIDAPTAVLIMLHSVNGIESWHAPLPRSVQKNWKTIWF
jgi:hypothetical protein